MLAEYNDAIMLHKLKLGDIMYCVRKNNYKTTIAFIFALLCIIVILFHSEAATSGAAKGLLNCARLIIPSLFPLTALVLFVFSTTIPEKLLKKDLYLALFISSFLGGYPTGSIVLKNAVDNNKTSSAAASKLINCCVNPGPAFILITVGRGILGSNALGLVLLCSSLLSATLLYLIIRCSIKEKIIYNPSSVNLSDAFVNSVYQAVQATLNICGYVILFSAIISVFNNTEILAMPTRFLSPILEVTNGVLSANGNIYIIAFLLGFGGICVHLQILSNTAKFMPKIAVFYLFRILNGLLNTAFTKVIVKFFGISVSTLSNNIQFTGRSFHTSFIQAISMVILAIALILSIAEKISVEKAKPL